MTTRERVEAMWPHTQDCTECLKTGVAIVEAAERKAVLAERAACVAAICYRCETGDQGEPTDSGIEGVPWAHRLRYVCLAGPIYARTRDEDHAEALAMDAVRITR